MPDLVKTDSGRLVLFAGLTLLAVWVLTRKGVAFSAGRSVVGGAAEVVTDAAAGAVVGIGEAIGLPSTSDDQCTIDLARGNWLAASASCPAPRFMKNVTGGLDFEARKAKFILEG